MCCQVLLKKEIAMHIHLFIFHNEQKKSGYQS